MGNAVMPPVLQKWLVLGVVLFSLQVAAKSVEPLRILTEHNPPAEYVDDTGRVTGVTVELVRLLQKRLNEPADIELMPWGRALNIARTGNSIMLFETVRTPEREAWFKWVGPVMLYNISLYGLKHRIGDDPADWALPGKYIACNYVNSITAQNLAELGFKDGKNLLLTSKSGDCLDMLLFERIDLIAVTEYALPEFRQRVAAAGYELVELKVLTKRKRYLAFSTDVEDERIASWQQALEQSYLDGTMRSLYQPVYSDALISRLEQFAAAVKR
ncbi:transporter substrate-binding domain-containing protein [Rheinheimera aquimaris]|uniref:Transporter substrate-binding domain-containing protein n=1 Tax=Rheinheimera aquimaris TaxID=412437 RepID=A0ABN1DD15_9GAMM|nr:transporter substrate-binding domain-containing protein [Rheinheimera aquimaris]MCB5212321.1 transporter substrate-binding domain-containing protein [Rheinheimera aquimaris]